MESEKLAISRMSSKASEQMLTTAGDEENDEKEQKQSDKGKDLDNIDIALRMATEEPFDPNAEEN